ncbi:MAG: hypothetical protein V4675_25150 [Verrucomicrobiota bacterium]
MSTLATLLIGELEKARNLTNKYALQDWSNAIKHHQELLFNGDLSKVPHLWDVFAPTCAWDDLSAEANENDVSLFVNTGNAVFECVDAILEDQNINIKEWRKQNS